MDYMDPDICCPKKDHGTYSPTWGNIIFDFHSRIMIGL